MRVDTPKKGSVLIVDDTPMNLEVLVKELTDQDFEVFVAIDGESAIRVVGKTVRKYTLRQNLSLFKDIQREYRGFSTESSLKSCAS